MPASAPATTGDRFRPTDPDFLQDPYPAYARLRREAPIALYEGWGAWIVTRHRDVDALLRDRRLGRVLHHLVPPEARPPADHARAAFDAIQAGSLLEIEPPDHTRVKQVVHDVFTPRHVRALRGRIEGLVEGLLDGIEARGPRTFDLIRDFAEPIPVSVIAELLGVPEADRNRLLPWSKAIIGMFEPERTPAAAAAADAAAAEFAAYVRHLMARKRAAPENDLISRMVGVHDADPERLTEGEVVANAILFLNAGHEAVVNVTGNGMLALLRHPDQLRAVCDDPALVRTAIEEMMRYDTPLQFFERLVLHDMTYEGHDWPRGTKLCLYYAAANRDPEVFVDPEGFDVRRDPNPHLAFGLGLHYCIGAPLARLELGVAVGALLRRFPGLHLATEHPRFMPKNVFRYLTELRVGV
jgi:cytochrome P450